MENLPEFKDAESKYYEQIGRDYTKPIKIFRTSDGEVSECPLIVGVISTYTANKVTKSLMFEFLYEDTYPMYNIKNEYIGFKDFDGKFHDMRTPEQKLRDYIENNKLKIFLWFTWLLGIIFMLISFGNLLRIGLGFILSIFSSYRLQLIDRNR